MPDFKNLSDSLKMEVLSEMADTYFGARRELDQMLEHFDRLTDQLSVLARTVERNAGLLHFLLLEDQGVPGFYTALGVSPEAVAYHGYKGAISSLNLPLALSPKGRWLRSVRRAYKTFQAVAFDYMHGHSEVDPKDRRRRRTSLHFELLQALAERINRSIMHVNRDLRLDDALEYAKGLEPGLMERERMAGAGQYSERGNSDFDFEPIAFEDLGLKAMPDLPDPKDAFGMARPWLKRFYRGHRQEITARMQALKNGRGRLSPEELSRLREPGKK